MKNESIRTSGLNLTGDLLVNNDEFLDGLADNVNESFNQLSVTNASKKEPNLLFCGKNDSLNE